MLPDPSLAWQQPCRLPSGGALLGTTGFILSFSLQLHIQHLLLSSWTQKVIRAPPACSQPCNKPQPSTRGMQQGRAGLSVPGTWLLLPYVMTSPGCMSGSRQGMGDSQSAQKGFLHIPQGPRHQQIPPGAFQCPPLGAAILTSLGRAGEQRWAWGPLLPDAGSMGNTKAPVLHAEGTAGSPHLQE